MRCAICYHLYNLKNVKNTHRGVLLTIEEAKICNFTKSNTPQWVLFTIFKLDVMEFYCKKVDVW